MFSKHAQYICSKYFQLRYFQTWHGGFGPYWANEDESSSLQQCAGSEYVVEKWEMEARG